MLFTNDLTNLNFPFGLIVLDTKNLTVSNKNEYISNLFPLQFKLGYSLLEDLSSEDFLLLKKSILNAPRKKSTFIFRIKNTEGKWAWTLWRIPYQIDSSVLEAYIIDLNDIEEYKMSSVFNLLLDIKLKSETHLSEITGREHEVLTLIAQGKRDKEISELLFISNYTVMNHRRSLLKKLKAKNKVELVKIAMEKNIL